MTGVGVALGLLVVGSFGQAPALGTKRGFGVSERSIASFGSAVVYCGSVCSVAR